MTWDFAEVNHLLIQLAASIAAIDVRSNSLMICLA